MTKLLFLRNEENNMEGDDLVILNKIWNDDIEGIQFDNTYGVTETYYLINDNDKHYLAIFREYNNNYTKHYPLYHEVLTYFVESDEPINLKLELESYLHRKNFYESDLW